MRIGTEYLFMQTNPYIFIDGFFCQFYSDPPNLAKFLLYNVPHVSTQSATWRLNRLIKPSYSEVLS